MWSLLGAVGAVCLLLLADLLLYSYHDDQDVRGRVGPVGSSLFCRLASPTCRKRTGQAMCLSFVSCSGLSCCAAIGGENKFTVPLLLCVCRAGHFGIQLNRNSLARACHRFLARTLLARYGAPSFVLGPSPIHPIEGGTHQVPERLLKSDVPATLPSSTLDLGIGVLRGRACSKIGLGRDDCL